MIFRSMLALLLLGSSVESVQGADVSRSLGNGASSGQQRFTSLPTKVGDQVEQQLAVEMQLKTIITQSGQIAHESESTLLRQQRRLVEVMEVDGKKLRTARVKFLHSRLQGFDEEASQDLVTQPIENKSYFVTCGEDQLRVTDLEGGAPPLEEFKLVSDSLAMLGKPNLLGKFLIERQPKVGERLLVPRAIAKSLLGMKEGVGAVKRFEMQLLEISSPENFGESPQAVFQAKLETMPNEASPMAFAVEGRVAIELAGCRTTAADLAGPISMATIQNTSEGFFQYSVLGEIKMALRTKYPR